MSKNFKIETLEDVSGLGLVKGFKVAGVACNIRGNADLERLDVALICSDTPATAAGVFTTNDVKAAPVYVDMEHLSRCGKVKAIVANSGNANACTGERGLKDARDTCAYLAGKFGVDENQILVCSTGRIGEFMPMEKLERGIDTAFSNLSDSDSFRYFCDFSQDFTKKSLFYFIEETGLEIMPCEKHTSLKPNEWEIGLFFAIGDTDYDDFHFLLRENNNVWSSKFGYDAKIEKIKDKNVISYLNSNHSTSYYHLEGFYKLKNPYADSREK